MLKRGAGCIAEAARSPFDVLTSVSGVTFEEAWPERDKIEGIHIPVINRQHLIQNKKSTGRPKNEADAIWLEGGGA